MKPPLKEYQRENVEWIQREKRGLLADEPGLGKSRSALEGFAGCERVLIIAPSLVVESGVWHDEVEQWGSDDTAYHLATYHQLNVRKPTGKGTGTKPINVLKDEWKGHWDAIIVDESHYIKGRNTAWTLATQKLAQNTDNMLFMTGTPIPNWSHELFTILQMLNPDEMKRGQELGSFWRWAKAWFDTSPTRFSNGNPVVGDLLGCTYRCVRRDPSDPCEHYERFAAANLGAQYMRHLRADHLDLPPINFVDVPTGMDTKTRHAYAELKRDFATDIGEQEVLAWSQGAKNVMLDKITTSPWLLTKDGEPYGGKFEQLRSDLRGRGEPTLVLAHYRDTVDACIRVAESQGLSARGVHGGTTDKQNAASIKSFKSGKTDVLVGSLETLAEGLTLTIADEAIFVERSYKPSRNIQATYRIHRLGQDKPCTIRRYITPNSVDSGKEKLLVAKTDHQMRTLTAAELLRVA